MRIVSWLFNFLLFLIALGFALSNTEPTDLRFLIGDLSWRAPLVIFLLVFFAAGVVIGLLAAVPAMFRQRREIARLSRELRHATASKSGPEPLPAEAAIGPGIGLGV
ncbi:LapA family protein [Burkholderiaceae bacterium FT117]|uniref:LapA family protein n=1 Tax=Zeimonas sediminis TaxID=2944268 RepID=UPI0023430A8F|nr:LapA family protein [Zeimonas sediminis]MCM5570017.1 LapA family protein [Zeimonas sediminis]